jgi:hypothetical protein
MVNNINNADKVYYIYKEVNGDLVVSNVFLADKEVDHRQLKIAMETVGWENLVYLINKEVEDNAGISVEFFDNREVF